jgi:energy-coupling factor transporter ATP-binding protein EcfA2
MTKVLAITGCMGSGKTTLVKQLQPLIPQSRILFEDDYQAMTQMDPEQLRRWISDGCCIDELDLHGFDLAVRRAIAESSRDWRDPDTKLLIIESQFGRAHASLKHLVDYQIWIESPLDLCLARKIFELTAASQIASTQAMGVGEILGFCKNYLDQTAYLLRKQKLLVEQVSNHTLVNDRSVPYLVDQALGVLHRQALFL